MLLLILFVGILFCNSQTFPTDWQNDGCIPEDEHFICISIDSLRNLNWIRNYVSYISIQLVSTSSTLSPIYTTNPYRIDNTNYKDTNDLSICFYPDLKSILHTSIQFNVYNTTLNSDIFIASYTIQNIHSFNLSTNQSPIVSTENLNNLDSVFTVSEMTHIPQIRFSLWLSSAQCMEITTSTMYFANDYQLHIEMYRLSEENNEPIQHTLFQTNKLSTYDTQPTFNSILCLSEFPTNKTQPFIGANFTLNDATTGYGYSLHTINNEYRNFYVTPEEYWEQRSFDANVLHFAMGNVQMNYWQSCSLTNLSNIIITEPDTFESVVTNTMYYTIILLAVILVIVFMCICSGCYTSSSYKGTDPIHYSNVLWFLLAVWNFCSQVMFATFLILQISSLNENEDNNELLFILIIVVISALLVGYLCNLLYLIHYLQIWNDPSAPGVTRHWLELWSWCLIFITMTMGGVHVALELCNSIIIPIDIFSMHLSHSELVRIRKDRIITNCLIQDLPILTAIVAYIFIISFFHKHIQVNQENIDIFVLLFSVKYIGIINALFSSIISIITSSSFRIVRRNYSHDNPIAQYQFSFTLKSNEWQSYWIHSHKKIQKCFKNAFDLRKLSLTIIDQCSESLNAMKIEGRLLRDNKHKSDRVEKMATGIVTKSEMKEIGIDLLKQFKNEFNILYSDDIRIDHLTIKPIFGGGEIVYNHRTCVQILCVGFLDCIRAIAHKCCPSFVQKPPNRRQSTIPVKSPRSYTHDRELEIDNNISLPKEGSDNSANVAISKQKTYSKPMTLAVEKSKDESRSTSSNLPMITISSQLEQLRDSFETENINQSKSAEMEVSQSMSTRNISKLDQQTLFADVYKEEHMSPVLSELDEMTPVHAHNPPNVINPQEWYAKYKQIEKKSTDQYGYESKKKISFLSHDDLLKQHAGDAPVTLSASRGNNHSSLLKTDVDQDEDEYDEYDDEEIDI